MNKDIHDVAIRMLEYRMYNELNAILSFYANRTPEFCDKRGFVTIDSWIKVTRIEKDMLPCRQRLIEATIKTFGENLEYS